MKRHLVVIINIMPTLLDVLESHKNNQKDKRKFGLVLQGGGMRAVYGAGALASLLEHNLSNVFDHVVGSSAGALHATYFLALDEETMRHTYSDDLTNKKGRWILQSNLDVPILWLS
jgi:predicted patatin/cPLA2 family phospholipase